MAKGGKEGEAWPREVMREGHAYRVGELSQGALDECDAERPDVRREGVGLAAEALGRHVPARGGEGRRGLRQKRRPRGAEEGSGRGRNGDGTGRGEPAASM